MVLRHLIGHRPTTPRRRMPAHRGRNLCRLDRGSLFNPTIKETVVSFVTGGLGFATLELLTLRIPGFLPPPAGD